MGRGIGTGIQFSTVSGGKKISHISYIPIQIKKQSCLITKEYDSVLTELTGVQYMQQERFNLLHCTEQPLWKYWF